MSRQNDSVNADCAAFGSLFEPEALEVVSLLMPVVSYPGRPVEVRAEA